MSSHTFQISFPMAENGDSDGQQEMMNHLFGMMLFNLFMPSIPLKGTMVAKRQPPAPVVSSEVLRLLRKIRVIIVIGEIKN